MGKTSITEKLDLISEQWSPKKGEMIVVPRGKLHKPFAAAEAGIMLIEPAGTMNTGDRIDSFTKETIDWI